MSSPEKSHFNASPKAIHFLHPQFIEAIKELAARSGQRKSGAYREWLITAIVHAPPKLRTLFFGVVKGHGLLPESDLSSEVLHFSSSVAKETRPEWASETVDDETEELAVRLLDAALSGDSFANMHWIH